MPKLMYIYGDDQHLLDTLLSALKSSGYSAEYTVVSNEADKNRIMADIAILCSSSQSVNPLKCGDLLIDLDNREVMHHGQPLHFTMTEFSLFSYLVKNSTRAVPRSELLSAVWGYANDNGSRVADDTVKRLRQKLKESGVAIETVWGYGFRLRVEQQG